MDSPQPFEEARVGMRNAAGPTAAETVLRSARRVHLEPYAYKGEVASAGTFVDWQDDSVRQAVYVLREHYGNSLSYFKICQRYGFQHPIQPERARQAVAKRVRRHGRTVL